MPADERDLRTLVGLKGRPALLLLGVLLVTVLMVLLRSLQTASPADTVPLFVAFSIIAMATAIVVLDPHEPIRVQSALFIASAGWMSTAIAHDKVATALAHHTTVHTAYGSGIALALLVLRGRLVLALVGCAATWLAVVVIGNFAPSSMIEALTPLANVAVAAVFAAIMRPTLQSLYELRIESTRRAATSAMVHAQNEERERQLTRIDLLARPMLERIARRAPLSAADRQECKLLEAELRDGLRAPNLVAPELISAARQARGRGVEVVLLDDGGLADVNAEVRAIVVDTAARELGAARDGKVTVRVLPVGRSNIATVLVGASSEDRRTEIDRSGRVRLVV